MNWYYVERGQQAGPVIEEQLDEMVRGGKLKANALVWHEGMPAWASYAETRGGSPAPAGSVAPVLEAGPQAVCSQCGRIFPIGETIRYGNLRVCAACKPVFLQKLQEGAPLQASQLNYAGFGIRFGAKVVDWLILGVPFMIVFIASGMVVASHVRTTGAAVSMVNFLPSLVQFLFLFLQLGYGIFFLGKYGATPGKMLCHLRVVTSDGGKIGYGLATARVFAEILSGLVCYLGYFMVLFDEQQRRALHDRICNTRVVRK